MRTLFHSTVARACVGATALLLARPALAVETPPAVGPAKDFQLAKVTRFTLPNGLSVQMVPFGSIPKVTIGLRLDAGAIRDGKADGIADLTADYLMEGTKNRNAADLNRTASGFGGALNVSDDADGTWVNIEALEEFGPEALALVSEVVREPAFPPAELARLRSKYARDEALLLSEPQPVANEVFARAVYGNHPYGRTYAKLKSYQALTVEQVAKFYAEHYGANHARLYIVGRYDEAAMKAAVEKAFGEWAQVKPPAPPKAHPSAKHGVSFVDHPGAVQSTIVLGRPVEPSSGKTYPVHSLTNALLGGSFGSRITANLREKHGYTYSPYSYIASHPGVAVWTENADVTTADTAAAVQEVVNEINLLRKTPPAPEELLGLQRYLSGIFVLSNTDRASIVSQLSRVDELKLGDDFLSTYVQKVSALTPAQVQQVAKKELDPAQMHLVVVGDRKIVEPTLKAFGKVTVVPEPTP